MHYFDIVTDNWYNFWWCRWARGCNHRSDRTLNNGSQVFTRFFCAVQEKLWLIIHVIVTFTSRFDIKAWQFAQLWRRTGTDEVSQRTSDSADFHLLPVQTDFIWTPSSTRLFVFSRSAIWPIEMSWTILARPAGCRCWSIRLKWLNNYWMNCHEVGYSCILKRPLQQHSQVEICGLKWNVHY